MIQNKLLLLLPAFIRETQFLQSGGPNKGTRLALWFISMFFMEFSLCAQDTNQPMITEGENVVITSDFAQIRFTVAGKGAPCIFLHGGPGQGSLAFRQMGGSNLQKCFTMIYMDQRGSGISTEGSEYSIERMVKDIEDVRASMQIPKVYLLAHSFGGILAVNYAKKYPQNVAGIILANATLHFYNIETLAERLSFIDKLLNLPQTDYTVFPKDTLAIKELHKRKIISKSGNMHKIITDYPTTLDTMSKIDKSLKKSNTYYHHMMASITDSTAKIMYKEYHEDYTKITPEIKCPVLVITATNDYSTGPKHYLHFKFPNQKTEIFEGGHFVFYEQNSKFVEAICKFLQGNK